MPKKKNIMPKTSSIFHGSLKYMRNLDISLLLVFENILRKKIFPVSIYRYIDLKEE